MSYSQELLDKILSRCVKEDGPLTTQCWVWQGPVMGSLGYGRVSHQGTDQYVHRIMYQACIGPIPDDLLVLHRCDNPACCNPEHLWIGCDQQNLHDAIAGELHPRFKLTDNKVREIKV
jgi:HNH endonuclease